MRQPQTEALNSAHQYYGNSPIHLALHTHRGDDENHTAKIYLDFQDRE